jgi:hypothetical protein
MREFKRRKLAVIESGGVTVETVRENNGNTGQVDDMVRNCR